MRISERNKERINALRLVCREKEWDAFIVTKRENMYYLISFTGSHGICIVSLEQVILFTDSRYAEQARKEVPSWVVVRIVQGSLYEACGTFCTGHHMGKVAVELYHIVMGHWKMLKKHAPSVTFSFTQRLIESHRAIKDEDEVKCIKDAYKIGGEMVCFLKKRMYRGYTERHLVAEAEYFLFQHNTQGTSFDPIIAAQPRSSMPHAHPTDHVIRTKDLVLMDIGVKFRMYNSDLTRNFILSRMPRHVQKIYQIVRDAQQKAIQSIRPGIRANEIDRIARDHIKSAGYGQYFGHSLGHGIGLEVHEEPAISPSNNQIIKEGMIFTIEPGIYLAGKFGIRIEDAVLVTKKGCEVLDYDIN